MLAVMNGDARGDRLVSLEQAEQTLLAGEMPARSAAVCCARWGMAVPAPCGASGRTG